MPAKLTVIAVLVLIFCASAARAIEPWASQDLKETAGLELWIDAKAQNPARESAGATPLAANSLCGQAFDGSGKQRHLSARAKNAQPQFAWVGDQGVFRFDGKDDCLEGKNPGQKFDEFTLFIVAAPKANPGGFRAFLSANEVGQNDYRTGLNVDLGGPDAARFDTLNVEGRGLPGAGNLFNKEKSLEFGGFHTIEVVGSARPGILGTWIDGQAQQQRERGSGPFSIDELQIGARFYSNIADPPCLSGFLEGDIAEVLLFSRALPENERQAIREYLGKANASLSNAKIGGRRPKPLEVVADPPPVEILAPGFEAFELPVKLKNINNIKYREDGKLVALGYDGRIFLLSNATGHGKEDTVTTFWDKPGITSPIGMALTPPGYPLGRGVFIASKGKVSLVVDKNGDDQADEEIIVASGWKPLDHGVDALGVVIDPRDGSVYFGLGTPQFGNGYLLDKDGKAQFDPAGEHGTIQKVSPDFKHRETYCNGIRFSIALRFNRAGDLFATDQEGATWMPNGNPLDELLHIQPGRFYGFPPRHPKHLPNVIDEPSTFDYRPQHQSVCGLNFNEPVNGGPVFGPKWWASDAIVSGYSRGKIYRTKLVKSAAGYVAQSSLLACLNMLTVDACVSPDGQLVVAVHSGGPDWGSGPQGDGKLYKIYYSQDDIAQPVVAWQSSPNEFRVAIDRPLPDPELLKDIAKYVTITYGKYVSAGDRFESFRPGYDVVQRQMAAPRYELPVYGVSLTADHRTLVISTAELTEATRLEIAMPAGGIGWTPYDKEPDGLLRQKGPGVVLGCDLSGVEATWQDASGETKWSGWLPTLDLTVARQLTEKVADCQTLWSLIESPGKLTLKTRLSLANLLHPAVQPGSKLDYTPEPEQVTLSLTGSGSLAVVTSKGKATAAGDAGKAAQLDIPLGTPATLEPFEVTLLTGGKTDLAVAYHTAEDNRKRPLQLERTLMPWARDADTPEPTGPRPVPAELAGGEWLRGRQVFMSNEAQCAKCHTVRGQGATIGPDLSNLVHRDYASVLRDITLPSFAINPDFINYNVVLEDGRVLAGSMRSEGDKIHVGDKDGRVTTVERNDVEKQIPQSMSLMPEGLPKVLGPEKMKDLLTFLLFEEPEELRPAAIERDGVPPARSRAEIDAVLKAGEPREAREPKPIKVVLVFGDKDHGPGEHDYPLWARRWKALLSLDKNVTVSTAHDWPSADDFKNADLLVWYSANPAWNAKKGADFDAFLTRGGGMVFLHFALNAPSDPESLAERIGLAWHSSAFRHGGVDLKFTDPKHPITAGFSTTHFEDESYWKMFGDAGKLHLLGTSLEEGAPQPILWTREVGQGRVFCSVLGHYTWTFDDPLFRVLILRGMAWTTREPLHRFDELVPIGARIKD